MVRYTMNEGMDSWGSRRGLMNESTEIQSEADLIPPGAPVGTIPSDLEQATGLERLEILGKMEGVDIFDMKPLDASRKGKRKIPGFSQTLPEPPKIQWVSRMCTRIRS
jgi:cytochrome c oxidase subunit 5b